MAGAGAAGMGMMGDGTCCPDGDCLCHGPDPTGLTSDEGPFATDSFTISGTGGGCVYFPDDPTAAPPFAAVTISDGFGGSGGCGIAQTGRWGPLYASHGIVAMIISTGAGDQPRTRGEKLGQAVATLKEANDDSSSPLYQKLSGRYGTSGFSMGGGGTSFASAADPTLRTSVQLMPWTPTGSGIMVPTLVVMGSSDGLAGSMGASSYRGIDDSVPKMQVTVASGHVGQPSAGGGDSGSAGLAFQKVFLEGDERWRPILLQVDYDQTNIQ
jgi:hypothetical protein